MPSLITHDFFGQDLYREMLPGMALAGIVGHSDDERDAFLLGNQGPDPLFYAVTVPWMLRFRNIGSRMHAEKPTELLCSLRRAADVLPEADHRVGVAYLAGFACHYALDSTAHPLIFAQQYAICDAGEPGLSRADGSEVHAVIETELDEMLLYTRTGKTVASFTPQRELLQASDRVLDVISRMYCYAVRVTYGTALPRTLFAASTRSFRRIQGLFHSPTGRKRAALSAVERLVRPHSFYGAMSHRPVQLEETPFENRTHKPWTNPFTRETSTASFSDLFEQAKKTAADIMQWLCAERFEAARAHEITNDLDFNGKPIAPTTAKDEELRTQGSAD